MAGATVMGVMVGLVGTFGDLCASMLLKRDIGIKDMGHLLKGHGGVMDRVDSSPIRARRSSPSCYGRPACSRLPPTVAPDYSGAFAIDR